MGAEYEHGFALHTGDALSQAPREQVMVSHVYPVWLCVHVDPLLTLCPSEQLDVAPEGVMLDA